MCPSGSQAAEAVSVRKTQRPAGGRTRYPAETRDALGVLLASGCYVHAPSVAQRSTWPLLTLCWEVYFAARWTLQAQVGMPGSSVGKGGTSNGDCDTVRLSVPSRSQTIAFVPATHQAVSLLTQWNAPHSSHPVTESGLHFQLFVRSGFTPP